MQIRLLNSLAMAGLAVAFACLAGCAPGTESSGGATLLHEGLDVSTLNNAQIAQVTRECHHRFPSSKVGMRGVSTDGAVVEVEDDDAGSDTDGAVDMDSDADESSDEAAGGKRSVRRICKSLFKRECKHGAGRDDDADADMDESSQGTNGNGNHPPSGDQGDRDQDVDEH